MPETRNVSSTKRTNRRNRRPGDPLIDHVRHLLGHEDDAAWAREINTSSSTITGWRERDWIPIGRLEEFAKYAKCLTVDELLGPFGPLEEYEMKKNGDPGTRSAPGATPPYSTKSSGDSRVAEPKRPYGDVPTNGGMPSGNIINRGEDRDVYVYEVSAANRWRAKDFAQLREEQIRALFPHGIGGQIAAPIPAVTGNDPPATPRKPGGADDQGGGASGGQNG
jgi:hypothetical protein